MEAAAAAEAARLGRSRQQHFPRIGSPGEQLFAAIDPGETERPPLQVGGNSAKELAESYAATASQSAGPLEPGSPEDVELLQFLERLELRNYAGVLARNGVGLRRLQSLETVGKVPPAELLTCILTGPSVRCSR